MNFKNLVFAAAMAVSSQAFAVDAILFVPEVYPIGEVNQGDVKHISLKGANVSQKEITLENVMGQGVGMILIDGGVTNPIPLNRVERHEGDLLVGIDVSGHDYKAQWEIQQEITEKRKRSTSLSQQILNRLLPDHLDFNYYTMLSRVSSLMIRQNSLLMAQLTKPDVLVDIQMARYGGFDYDKSEKLIAIGRQKTRQTLLSV